MEYTHTVHCFTDPKLRKDFSDIQEAINYANDLLADDHKVKIYPYHRPKKAIDFMVERLEKDGRL